jgi:CRISPR-associated protein Cmr4
VSANKVQAHNDLENAASRLLESWNGLGDREGTTLVGTASPLIAKLGAGHNAPGSVVLEEYEYEAAQAGQVGAFGTLLDQCFQGAPLRLSTHLAVISDDAFGYATKFATEVMARIALDYNSKTVKDKALFYEEFLPSSTIFYSVAIAEKPRKTIVPGMETEEDVLGFVSDSLASCANVIQVGANATTGKGLCTAMLV